MHKVVPDGISENMASLVQLGEYGAIDASGPTKTVYIVIKYLSEPYTLQEYQTIHVKVSKSVELVVKA